MQPVVQANGILRPCCAEAANLERVRAARDAKGLLHWHDRCATCGRNHYGMEVEPPVVGAQLRAA